ncbi:MAG TPA: RNA polymerase sigma-70 factor [Candidatus Limnocylindria bacterium]|nr:RNA polymerase sigma-70 factor [Candidatus Limnocylindria bacterium]
MTTVADVYIELRPLLFSIAYRMLGSVADAEDVVQESFLRFHTSAAEVDSPKAYLSAITTRLCIDHLRSARVRRETYVGEWLPEPLLTDDADPAAAVADADSLSMSFLLVLERLSPVERAVFLLHDVFAYGFREIAGIVDRTPEHCRQIAVRARRHVTEHAPRFDASRAEQEALAERFFAAFTEGDVDGLVSLLAADAVVQGDSGGHRPSWPNAIIGRAKIVRLLVGLARDMQALDVTLRRTHVNGQPGATIHGPDGGLINVLVLDIADGTVQTVRSVINPDKLGHLGPLADREQLLARRSAERG